MITQRQMALAMPLAAHLGRIDVWYQPLVDTMLQYDIDETTARQAMFLANLAEETGELSVQEENLHYTAEQLKQYFPGLFPTLDRAQALAVQGPQAIANFIYADANRPKGYRMGNTQPGDGWRYRGRGPMQITGRQNYESFFTSLGLPADSDPDLLLQPSFGAKAAGHYWSAARCNTLADAGDFDGIVHGINGGTINIAARRRYLTAFETALAGTP